MSSSKYMMVERKHLRLITRRLLSELRKRRLLDSSTRQKILDRSNVLSPFGWIVYRLASMGLWETVYEIIKIRPGEIVIHKNGVDDDLFEHPHVKLYHEYIFSVWEPDQCDILVLLPCTNVKPYRRSPIHRAMLSYAKRISKRGVKIEIYAISEPMLIVPLKYDNLYPVANYDFPPKDMKRHERKKFVDLLAKILPKIVARRKKIVAFMPRHHSGILMDAIKKANCKLEIEFWPYGRLAFKSAYTLYKHILGILSS